MCNEFGHLAKDCSYRIFRSTPILIVKSNPKIGQDTNRGTRGRGSSACGGGHEATQIGNGHGKFYTIPRPKTEASNFVITGIALV